MKQYRIVELFSGIGSQAKALEKIGIKVDLIKTCEWDIHAMIAYEAIHEDNNVIGSVEKLSKRELLEQLEQYNLSNDGKEQMKFEMLKTYSTDTLKRILSSIIRTKNAVDVTALKGSDLPADIDLLTYSFPCQDLSNVGAFHGYNKGIDKDSGSRSSLLWQVGRILKEMKDKKASLPRFLVLENVPALLADRHIKNFRTWQSDLEELGYHNKVYLMNAVDYGIPQNRPRLIMISTKLPDDEVQKAEIKSKLETYYQDNDITDKAYISKIPKRELKEFLRTDYTNKSLLQEALESQPNDTESRRDIWDNNPKLIDEKGNMQHAFVRTITTKQDRDPNSGNIYFDYEGNTKSKFRYLTPRECFLLMGFDEKDYESIIEKNPEVHKGRYLFSRDKIIRMAGNSIPVNLLEYVFRQVSDLDKSVFLRED